MKRFLLTLAVILLTVVQADAVLKEKNLNRTLGVLKLELRNNHIKQRIMMERMVQRQEMQHAQLLDYMQRSEQISLMLYSQKSDFTFDIAYACQQATELYRELHSTNMPYDEIRTSILTEVARYDSLIYALQQLPPAIGNAKSHLNAVDTLLLQMNDSTKADSSKAKSNEDIYELTEQEQKDREICLIHAKSLRNNLLRILISITKDKQYYDHVNDKVERLNQYAQMRYKMLQDNIFVKGGDNYFKLLVSIPRYWERIKQDFADKYSPLGSNSRYSQWRGPQVIFVSFAMIIYLIIASIISNVILRWIVPKRFRTESFTKKRPAYIMALGILIFTGALFFVMETFKDMGPVQMATGLMMNMTWLMQAVLVSLLIRLKGDQIKHGVQMYTPFLAMAFVVILFRIVLIPNNIINLMFPPILLGFTIWQMIAARRARRHVPVSDKFYNIVSMFVMCSCLLISWAGFTLLAVQVIIWWTFQLAAIQTITCLYDVMEMYEDKFLVKRIRRAFFKDEEMTETEEVTNEHVLERMRKGDFVTLTWFYDLVNRAIVPILGVLSVLFSIAFAADTFEMRETCTTIFFNNFIDVDGVVKLSIFKICLVVSVYFIFRYFEYSIRSFYFYFKKNMNDDNEEFNHTLAKNVIAILVWGSFCIFAMVLLNVPKSGIEVVTAGLATGMGFAMKDLLENFFYGISLMTGRLRVGDYIECDGISGKVESITYQSTQIISMDGAVIAFLNSSLFSKNFRNLTRNHQYELIKIPVGVAYGSDIKEVRDMLLKDLAPLAKEETEDGRMVVNPEKGISVVFSDFGASSVDLLVTQWLLVDQKIAYQARAKEIIYNTLNSHNIEIPFPQQDVYIRKISNGDISTPNIEN